MMNLLITRLVFLNANIGCHVSYRDGWNLKNIFFWTTGTLMSKDTQNTFQQFKSYGSFYPANAVASKKERECPFSGPPGSVLSLHCHCCINAVAGADQRRCERSLITFSIPLLIWAGTPVWPAMTLCCHLHHHHKHGFSPAKTNQSWCNFNMKLFPLLIELNFLMQLVLTGNLSNTANLN